LARSNARMSPDAATKARFRLGLLVERTSVSKYVYEFIKWALANENLELTTVFIRSSENGVVSFPLPDYWHEDFRTSSEASLSLKFAVALERLLLLKNRDHHRHLDRFDLAATVPAEMICELRSDENTPVGEPILDLLVTFAPSPFGAGLWNVAKLGIIALSPYDDRLYRGGPPGFWEVYFREDVTGFTIQRLQQAPGTPETLFSGRVATQFYYLLNQASLFQKSAHYLRRIVNQTALTGTLPSFQAKLPFSGPARGTPTAGQSLRYALRFGRLLFSKILQKLGFDYRWKVGFLPGGWRGAALWRARVIKNDRGHYLADPFVITRDGKHFCFVEDYDIVRTRGRICAYRLGDAGADYIGVALEEDFHLSYPYLFDYKGELFMCPETSAAREIRVYKCVDFPLHWKLESTLMKGVSAADTMLFERSGRWWMLTNIDPAGWGDHSLELHVFSAETPLSGDWRPHKGNPLFIDAARTRNGGMVKDGDRLFRVAQGQGFGMYGKRTTINEIVELTDDRYAEQPVCVISPTFRPKIFGTHHLHSDGNITVFDFA
jgi:hypothetical protein